MADDQLYAFSQADVERIASAVRRVEGAADLGQPARHRAAGPVLNVPRWDWVQVTGPPADGIHIPGVLYVYLAATGAWLTLPEGNTPAPVWVVTPNGYEMQEGLFYPARRVGDWGPPPPAAPDVRPVWVAVVPPGPPEESSSSSGACTGCFRVLDNVIVTAACGPGGSIVVTTTRVYKFYDHWTGCEVEACP